MNVTAYARPAPGGWWAVEVPDVPGLFTQARELDQIPEMVRDAAEALGAKVASIKVVSTTGALVDA